MGMGLVRVGKEESRVIDRWWVEDGDFVHR